MIRNTLSNVILTNAVFKKHLLIYATGIVATEVNAEQIPCSIMEMSFFNKLKDPENRITYDSNKIRKSMRYNDEGDMITDNLKAVSFSI